MTVRLFLIDDHPLVRDGLRARLGAVAGLEIVGEAGSGAEALALVDGLRPDLLLMDVGMKDMNGIELAALLLQRKPALHIVMLSMYDNPEYVQKALQVGARGYVLKDSRSAEIVGAIRTVHGGGTYLSPSVAQALFRGGLPVIDLQTGKVEITSMNHGFAVDETTLPANLRPTHISLFDNTLQGLARTDKPAFCFQGHPEASPGPHDIGYLFDRFVGLMASRNAAA